MAAFVTGAVLPFRRGPSSVATSRSRPAAAARSAVTMMARGRRGGGNAGSEADTVDYESQTKSVLADDMCDVTGQNCGPDGTPPAAASKVVPERPGQTATEGRMPPLTDYSGKESVLQSDAHETSG